jgi:DNA repair protein RecO (recombination protein O)
LITTAAFVLRQVNYRESDKIVTLYSRELGKTAVFARGIRKNTKSIKLAPYNLFMVSLVKQRKGNLYEVKDILSVEPLFLLSASIRRMSLASCLIELISELSVEEGASVLMYDLISNALLALGKEEKINCGYVYLSSVINLLNEAGFGISVRHCSVCNKLVPDKRSAFFNPSRGGVVCTPCGGGSFLLSSDEVWALKKLERFNLDIGESMAFSEETLKKIELALDAFILYQLEKKLKTIEFKNKISI